MRSFILLILGLVALPAAAQERRLVRKGNELYAKGQYAEAAQAYGQAAAKSPSFTPGVFNLGVALIRQNQAEAARRAMDNAAKVAKDPVVQSNAHYNIGNTWMDAQQWQKALDAYKAALRRNPDDSEARYNYAYALAKLRQGKGGGGGGEDKKDKQDQDKKKGQQEQQQNKENGQQRPQPKPGRLSEQQADNMLKALQQEERRVQDKMQQGRAVPVKMEKDW